MRLLIAKGANVNATSKNGTTKLMQLSTGGLSAEVELLLERGADVNAKTKDGGWTALMQAARRCALIMYAGKAVEVSVTRPQPAPGSSESELVRRLVERHGADVNLRDKYGQTALHHAATVGHVAAARILLERGADVNFKDSSGKTPLLAATERGWSNLDSSGGGISFSFSSDGKPSPPMHSFQTRREVVELLLSFQSDVNAKTKEGWTALMYAVMNGDAGVSRMLLEKGAEVNAKNNQGKTALRIASESQDGNLISLLKQHGTK